MLKYVSFLFIRSIKKSLLQDFCILMLIQKSNSFQIGKLERRLDNRCVETFWNGLPRHRGISSNKFRIYDRCRKIMVWTINAVFSSFNFAQAKQVFRLGAKRFKESFRFECKKHFHKSFYATSRMTQDFKVRKL